MSLPALVLAAGLGCALVTACGGAEIRGGRAVPESALGRTTRLHTFIPNDCRDAHENPTVARGARVDIVRLSSGAVALVEYRAGHDALVVENSFSEGRVQVFQVIVEDEDHAPLLHEFRVPEQALGSGEVRVSDRFETESLGSGSFRARASGLVARCQLAPAVEQQLRSG